MKKRCIEERKALIKEASIARITTVYDHHLALDSQRRFADFVRNGGRYSVEEADACSRKKLVEFVAAETAPPS
jgi:hypothetical protein